MNVCAGMGGNPLTGFGETARHLGLASCAPNADAVGLVAIDAAPITFSVHFPFSMHIELLRYWEGGTALRAQGINIRTVPPPLMGQAFAAGEIDAFCVGEPWGSTSVESGAG
ncbi:MAG: ABC transporter substrate-binding protein, partial [Pseudomonadota bacterium]